MGINLANPGPGSNLLTGPGNRGNGGATLRRNQPKGFPLGRRKAAGGRARPAPLLHYKEFMIAELTRARAAPHIFRLSA